VKLARQARGALAKVAGDDCSVQIGATKAGAGRSESFELPPTALLTTKRSKALPGLWCARRFGVAQTLIFWHRDLAYTCMCAML